MDIKYTYTTSPEYSRSLDFDYIETYSFRRGAAFLEQVKYKKETEIQYLLDANGHFHFSSAKTNTFKKKDAQMIDLLQILQTKITDVPRFMCAPEYRDAIVFYNQAGQIISCLNVCLSCQYMETKKFSHIDADFETYDLLKKWFIGIGHDVERPDHFIMDEVNRLKNRQKKP